MIQNYLPQVMINCFNNLPLAQVPTFLSKITFVQLQQVAFLYNLYDSALANILALDTCRHGTSITGFAQIFFFGGRTDLGGAAETTFLKAYSNNLSWNQQRENANKSRIYVWNDNMDRANPKVPQLKNLWFIAKRIAPIVFSCQANTVLFPKGAIAQVAGSLLAIYTPTVKYRFTPQELKEKFEDDPDLTGIAKRTSFDISPSHLGISGSLIQGVNLGVFERIKNKPGTFALGCAQLIAAIALTIIWTGVQTSCPTINVTIQAVTAFTNYHTAITRVALCALTFSTW